MRFMLWRHKTHGADSMDALRRRFGFGADCVYAGEIRGIFAI
jgi:hypothetical protein